MSAKNTVLGMCQLWLLVMSLGLALVPVSGHAREQFLPEPQETRFRILARDLRCVVCQNESLVESQAPLAADLRAEIRMQIRTGKRDTEILDYLVTRYGDFVSYRPPLNRKTYLLWFGPLTVLVFLMSALWLFKRKLRAATQDPDAAQSQVSVQEALQRLNQQFGSRDD